MAALSFFRRITGHNTLVQTAATPQGRANENPTSLVQRMRSSITGFFSNQNDGANDGDPESPDLSMRAWIYDGHLLFTTPALTSLIASYLLGDASAYSIDRVLAYDPDITLSLCLSNKKSLTIQEVSTFQQETAFKAIQGLEVLKKCSNLEHVDLSEFNFFHQAPKFEDLSRHLKSVKFDQLSEEDLITFVSHVPGLTSIDLTNTRSYCDTVADKKTRKKIISNAGIEILARSCPDLVAIKIPSLNPKITDASLTALGSHCHHLTSVDCNNSYTTMGGAAALAQQCPSLRSIFLELVSGSNMELQALAEHSPHLTSINLAYHRDLDDATLTHLALHWPKLQAINLYACTAISNAGVQALANSCSEITSINLGYCAVSDAGIQAIIKNCTDLTSIELQDCKEISNAAFEALFKHSPHLTTVDVTFTQVTDKELIVLSQSCPNLTFINVNLCRVTEVGLEALAKGCPRAKIITVNQEPS